MPSYEPKGADVWSLGIVLLNLLFHRCPWADPTLDDPDFYAFRRDPIQFLETRFEGIGSEVATFLANRVFCDVEDIDSSPESMRDDAPLPSSVATATPLTMRRSMPKNTRVTAGEFAKWATKLVRYMGEGSRRASISDSTRQIVHTIRQSPRIEAGRAFQSPPARSPRHSIELQRPTIMEGSPSRKAKRLSIGLPNDLMEELEKAESADQIPTIIAGLASAPEDSSPLTQSLDGHAHDPPSVEPPGRNSEGEQPQASRGTSAGEAANLDSDEPPREGDGEACIKEKARRRKRGARKGKGHHREKGEGDEAGKSASMNPDNGALDGAIRSEEGSSISPESPILDIVDTSKTLQAYAREISQTTKPPLVTSASYTPGLISEVSSGRLHTVSTSALSPPSTARPAPASKSRFADKLKNAFANGNPELQAFAARAKERDMALTGIGERNPTASAPAKMQHSSASFQHPSSQLSSFGSVASSTGSWSEDGAAGKHWASTSSRRVRVDKTKRHPDEVIVPGSVLNATSSNSRPGRQGSVPRNQYGNREQASNTGSSPSPSRMSLTPLSSFSSVTSYDSRPAAGQSSSSPTGLPSISRTPRSPLHSIDETGSASSLKERPASDDDSGESITPLVGSLSLDPSQRLGKPAGSAPALHILREPKQPPADMQTIKPRATTEGPAAKDVRPDVLGAPPSVSKARIGKFFNKFSRN